MLMKGRLTINNSVCGRWLLSLFTMLLMSVGMQAEDYGLVVAGVQVTDPMQMPQTSLVLILPQVQYHSAMVC